MSQFDWQLIAVVLALAAAAAHLGRRVYRLWWTASGTSSGSCGNCSTGAGRCSGNNAGFVPLETLQLPAPQLKRTEEWRGQSGTENAAGG